MKKQKLVSLLLAITTVIAMFPSFFVPAMATETTPTAETVQSKDLSSTADGDTIELEEADGTKKTFVVIRSTGKLTEVLTADTEHTDNYILDADLDYSDAEGKTTKFTTILLGKGQIFDGNGHSMTGFYVDDTSNTRDAGSGCVFARTSGTTGAYTIRNLTIGSSGNEIEITNCSNGSGALVGYTGDSGFLFENVTVYANFSVADGITDKRIGGLAGDVRGSVTITNCKFYGSVTNTTGISGGLIGYTKGATVEDSENYGTINLTINSSTVSDFYAGGLIGQCADGILVVNNCKNYGAITGHRDSTSATDKEVAVGGIIGIVSGTGEKLIQNCENYGKITATTLAGTAFGGGIAGRGGGQTATPLYKVENCVNYGALSGSQLGGIVGRLTASATSSEIVGCLNYGTISSNNSCGGIVGTSNYGDGTTAITNCLNAATITGNNAGGIMGWISKGVHTLTNTSNIGSVKATNAGGLVAQLSTTMTLNTCGSFGTTSTSKTDGSGTQSAIVAVKAVTLTITNVMRTAVASDSYMVDDVEGQVKTVDMAGAVKWLRTQFADSNLLFALSDDALSVVVVGTDDTTAVAEAKFLQYRKDTTNNVMDLRILGVLNDNDLAKYANVGFKLVIKPGTGEEYTETVTVNQVYSSIIATEGHTITEYSAEDLGATYLYAVELYNIPLDKTFTVDIQAFSTEIGEKPTYDNLVTVTIVNGQIQ